MKRVGTYMAAALAGIVALLVLMGRTRPVLVSLPESGHPFHGPFLSIFNPFRDKLPERVAEKALVDLREGHFDSVFRNLQLPEEMLRQKRQLEMKCRLRSWKLVDREDRAGQVRLLYKVWRDYPTPRKKPPPGIDTHDTSAPPAWLVVTRATKGATWTVTDLQTAY
jgi:hypothetical protein